MSSKPQTPPIWFVRGVPEHLQKEVRFAAKRYGTTIGYIVAEAVRRQLADMKQTLDGRLTAHAADNAQTEEPGQLDMFGPKAAQAQGGNILDPLDLVNATIAAVLPRIVALEARLAESPSPPPTPSPESPPKPPKSTPEKPSNFDRMLTSEQAAEVGRLRAEGRTYEEICGLLGFTQNQVRGALRRLNGTPRNKGKHTLAPESPSVQDTQERGTTDTKGA